MKPNTIRINSKVNDFQHAQVLKNNRIKRQKNHKFFVEGVRSINQLVASDWEIDVFLFSSDKKLSTWAQEILNNSRAKHHFDLKFSLLQELSSKEETSELIALVYMAKDDLSRIKFHKNSIIVVLDRPINPGNLGTIIRSCNSLNVDGIIISGHAVDLYDPKTIQSSVGSFFSIPIIRIPSYNQVNTWINVLKKEYSNIQVVGTSAKANKEISLQDFTKPTIILIGNETLGLSQNYKLICDELVKIPLFGRASSLNVSCATSIVLYEIARQRNFDFIK